MSKFWLPYKVSSVEQKGAKLTLVFGMDNSRTHEALMANMIITILIIPIIIITITRVSMAGDPYHIPSSPLSRF